MRNSSKISIALVACWLFSVTVVSDFVTFNSGSTTGSVEVSGGISLQSIIDGPSIAFTIWEFYTLMAPGATPGNMVSSTAACDYPKITTAIVFPGVFSSTIVVNSPFGTAVDALYTLVFGSVMLVGTPGLSAATTISTSTPPRANPPTPTPAPSHASTPAPSQNTTPPQPSPKAATMFATGVCGRPGEADGGRCGARGVCDGLD